MKEKYGQLSDEQIVLLAQNQDKDATDYLMEKYKNLVRKKARTLFLAGGDGDDLIQEGMIGLYHAIRDYQEDRQTKFSTFAGMCVTRQMYTAIKAFNRQKNLPLNTYISLYAKKEKDLGNWEEERFLLDEFMQLSSDNPEDIVINRENFDLLNLRFRKSLSKLEQNVLDLYLSGMTYTQIATELKRSAKTIDNALQRIKNKLRDIFEKNSCYFDNNHI